MCVCVHACVHRTCMCVVCLYAFVRCRQSRVETIVSTGTCVLDVGLPWQERDSRSYHTDVYSSVERELNFLRMSERDSHSSYNSFERCTQQRRIPFNSNPMHNEDIYKMSFGLFYYLSFSSSSSRFSFEIKKKPAEKIFFSSFKFRLCIE